MGQIFLFCNKNLDFVIFIVIFAQLQRCFFNEWFREENVQIWLGQMNGRLISDELSAVKGDK